MASPPLTLFGAAQRAMSAQLVRMNAAASNLANAGTVSGSEADAYRPIRTVFAAEVDRASGLSTERMRQLQEKLTRQLAEAKVPQRIAKQVRMIDTTEGIRIDLVDDADFTMFLLGTTVLTDDATQLLKAIGAVIAPETGTVSIRGHTDALPWRGQTGVNNWSLSAGRAEATRQALLRRGIAEGRYRKIEGVADREPLIRDQPQDPRNRRISILLLR